MRARFNLPGFGSVREDPPARVVNVGLERFAIELAAQGVKVTHVDWVPPARGNAKLAELLSKLGS